MDRRFLANNVLSPVVFTVAMFVIWEIACKALKIPVTFLPAPTDVWGALVKYWGPIVDNSMQTLWTTLAGFLIATVFGLLLGITVGMQKPMYAGLYPCLEVSTTGPK